MVNVCICFFIGVLAAQSDCCQITKVSMTPYVGYADFPPVQGCNPAYSPYYPISSSVCTPLPNYQELVPRVTRTTTRQRYYHSPTKTCSTTYHHCRHIPPKLFPVICQNCQHIPTKPCSTACHHCHHILPTAACTNAQRHQCTENGCHKQCCCCNHGSPISLYEPCCL